MTKTPTIFKNDRAKSAKAIINVEFGQRERHPGERHVENGFDPRDVESINDFIERLGRSPRMVLGWLYEGQTPRRPVYCNRITRFSPFD